MNRSIPILASLLLFISFGQEPTKSSAQQPERDHPNNLPRLIEILINKGVMSGNPGITAETDTQLVWSIMTEIILPSPAGWLLEGPTAIDLFFSDKSLIQMGDKRSIRNPFSATLERMQNLPAPNPYTEMGKPNT